MSRRKETRSRGGEDVGRRGEGGCEDKWEEGRKKKEGGERMWTFCVQRKRKEVRGRNDEERTYNEGNATRRRQHAGRRRPLH